MHDLVIPLPAWLADRNAGSDRARWAIWAVLALADSTVGWEGDMRHQPYIGGVPAGDGGTTHRYMVVKQDNDGYTFIVSQAPMPWLEARSNRHEEVRGRDLGRYPWEPENLGQQVDLPGHVDLLAD
ncbi:hypothetical protein DKT69_03710 [Micromonospora sicca]|uniref:Uncharacterized protein n=1 Tax=Micromonospora sicca TaxID=2202420 RepID=A0A317DQA7_9ACTN|nr:hypothetical protein [Micromonospora sp. 4G51]PWR16797.1 hypothetical protein DKT69_03710 [Micromonospora sp. 4G51]